MCLAGNSSTTRFSTGPPEGGNVPGLCSIDWRNRSGIDVFPKSAIPNYPQSPIRNKNLIHRACALVSPNFDEPISFIKKGHNVGPSGPQPYQQRCVSRVPNTKPTTCGPGNLEARSAKSSSLVMITALAFIAYSQTGPSSACPKPTSCT